MQDVFEVISQGPGKTRQLGFSMGEKSTAGDVFLLTGDLGAGKTCLAQGIARGLGIRGAISSPSFVLIREYPGRLPFYHIDLYRLGNIQEAALLGLEDYLYGQGVCVVEWAEKGGDIFPEEHLLVEMEFLSARKRLLRFRPRGEHFRNLVVSTIDEKLEVRS